MDTKRLRAALLIGFTCMAAVLCSSTASATALYDVSAQATLQPSLTTGSGLQLSSLVSDAGDDPSTTFSFVDPFGSSGSTADAAGSAALQGAGNDQMLLSIAGNGSADGKLAVTFVSSFSNATVVAGFFLTNTSADPLSATVAIDWTWQIATAIDNAAFDSASARVVLDVFRDGLLLEELLNEFREMTDTATGQWTQSVSLAAGEEVLYSALLTLTALAQSASQEASVPVPSSSHLTALALVIAGLSRVGRMHKGRALPA